MKIVNVLHKLRSLVPDNKVSGVVVDQCTLYDDDYYTNVIRSHGHNPNAMYTSISSSDYDAMVLDVWYKISGDLTAIRKLEEIGILKGEFNAEARIRSLLSKSSELEIEVYNGVRLP